MKKTALANNAANSGETAAAPNRREFLRGGFRYALLAGVGAVSALLLQRRGAGLPGQTCINQGICRGCGAFKDCGLPQALSARSVAASRKSAAVFSAKQEAGGSLPSSRYGNGKASKHETRIPTFLPP